MARKFTEEDKLAMKEANRLRREEKRSIPPRILQINEEYRVTADDVCFTIERRRKTKKGEYVWGNEGYFTELDHVIHSLAKKFVRGNLDDLRLVANMIRDLRDKKPALKSL
jgi:hypothetical protein